MRETHAQTLTEARGNNLEEKIMRSPKVDLFITILKLFISLFFFSFFKQQHVFFLLIEILHFIWQYLFFFLLVFDARCDQLRVSAAM